MSEQGAAARRAAAPSLPRRLAAMLQVRPGAGRGRLLNWLMHGHVQLLRSPCWLLSRGAVAPENRLAQRHLSVWKGLNTLKDHGLFAISYVMTFCVCTIMFKLFCYHPNPHTHRPQNPSELKAWAVEKVPDTIAELWALLMLAVICVFAVSCIETLAQAAKVWQVWGVDSGVWTVQNLDVVLSACLPSAAPRRRHRLVACGAGGIGLSVDNL
eukprot:359930-Chlamydomonas_euryale.AAC.2